MLNTRIGIVGLGFVGTAVYEGFRHHPEVRPIETYDTNRNKPRTCKNLVELALKSDVIFVCVPTPVGPNGECDTSIVERVVGALNQVSQPAGERSGLPLEVIIKSTVPPGTTERLQAECPKIVVGFNPEFLTERNAIRDFQEQDRIIIGYVGNRMPGQAWDVYSTVYGHVPQYRVSARVAEMVKYVGNSFLAMKVSFANEIYAVCQKTGIDYEIVKNLVSKDERIGPSHWDVPGPDGKFGWGGTCFPKDTLALVSFAEKNRVEMPLLNAVRDVNFIHRGE